MNNLNINDMSKEDRIALGEAYRVYEILEPQEKLKIPQFFVDLLIKNGDITGVKPFEKEADFSISKLSEKGKYIVMYMCTFE